MDVRAIARANTERDAGPVAGTFNLDIAQVLVQNRVSAAEPRLPEEVRRIGVTVRKNSPDLMMVIHLTSPNRPTGISQHIDVTCSFKANAVWSELSDAAMV